MRTNIDIDDTLMSDAMRVLGAKTKREAVETALRDVISLRQQEALMDLWGIGWEGDLDEMRTDKPLPEFSCSSLIAASGSTSSKPRKRSRQAS